MEVWKEIKGFEGLYEVSSEGNVRHIKFNRILKPGNCRGYERVVLCKNNKHYNKSIHRLVAEAFLPNPYNLPQVNHKDECKSNNNVDNLEWCDAKYNTNYGSGIEKSINTKIKKGIFDKSHIGMSANDLNRIYRETHREYLKQKSKEYYHKKRLGL